MSDTGQSSPAAVVHSLTSALPSHDLLPVPPSASSSHTAAVIFLHGVGSTGDELRSQLSTLVQPPLEQRFPHIRFLFPTAPLRSFTAFKGRVLPAWFDRAGYGLQWEEDGDGVHESCTQVNELIRQCNMAGIANTRIILGGFSMGGAQAMHSAFSPYGATSPYLSVSQLPLAGCFCISSYLPRSCKLPSSLAPDSIPLATPLLFMHGASDGIVRPSWAEDTCRRMQQAGVLCLFNMYERQMHALSSHQIGDLVTFVAQFLPRDVKSQPAVPSSPAPDSSQQQEQQLKHAVDESMDKPSTRSASSQALVLSSAASSSSSSSSTDSPAMRAYLETLKPHNTDLR